MKRVLNSIYSEEEEDDDPLQKQFKTLEIEWKSIKQSIFRSNRRKPTTDDHHRLFQQYDNSPKKLMSVLQNENPPSNEFFPNSGHHDQAAIEIIEQRKADFDNGRLRGRRLFQELDEVSDDNGIIHDECFDTDEKSEASTEYSCTSFENYDGNCNRKCSSPRFCTDSPWWSDEAERGVKVVAVKRGIAHGRRGSAGILMFYVVVLFAIAIVVFNCSGEDEQILVPT